MILHWKVQIKATLLGSFFFSCLILKIFTSLDDLVSSELKEICINFHIVIVFAYYLFLKCFQGFKTKVLIVIYLIFEFFRVYFFLFIVKATLILILLGVIRDPFIYNHFQSFYLLHNLLHSWYVSLVHLYYLYIAQISFILELLIESNLKAIHKLMQSHFLIPDHFSEVSSFKWDIIFVRFIL